MQWNQNMLISLNDVKKYLSRKVKYYKKSTLVSDPKARLNITGRSDNFVYFSLF